MMKDKGNWYHSKKEVFLTKHQIADLYGICVRTLNRKLSEQGIILSRGLVSPMELKKIMEVLGESK